MPPTAMLMGPEVYINNSHTQQAISEESLCGTMMNIGRKRYLQE